MNSFAEDCVIIFIEIWNLKLFLETFCAYKSRLHRKRSYLMLAAIVFISVLISNFVGNFGVKQLLLTIGYSVIAKQFFDSRYMKLVGLSILFQGLMIAIELLIYICHLQWILLGLDADTARLVTTLAGFSAKLLQFVAVLIIRKVARQSKTQDFTNEEWLQFLVIPIFSAGICTVVQAPALTVAAEYSDLLWTAGFGILFMNFLVFYLMRSIARREERLRLYQSIVESYEKQNERIHEYRNQIECLQELGREGRYPELNRYLEQIGGKLANKLDAVDTHHVVVNVIVNSKYREATEKGILMVMRLDDLSGLWLSEHDTVVLLANLLDNAIEACQKLEGRRVIKVKMAIEKGGCVLSVRNTYDGTVRSEEGVLLSTKEDADKGHGIGVKNIVKVIEKYGGSYLIEPLEHEFVFSVMLPRTGKEEKRAG